VLHKVFVRSAMSSEAETALGPGAPCSGTITPPGASPIERLLETLNAHIDAQQASLLDHRRFVDSISDPVVRFLAQRVAESKNGHRNLLRQIAASLRDALYWTHSPDALPRPERVTGGEARQGHATLRELVRTERELGRTTYELARAYARIDGGLDALLLETMAMDSVKHERVLQFAARRLQRRAEAPESELGVAPDIGAASRLVERVADAAIREPVRAPETTEIPLGESHNSWPTF
jgi:hypothetical protein